MAAVVLQGTATVAKQALGELRRPLNVPAEWSPIALIRCGGFRIGETRFIFGEPVLWS
jgi:hypothetical protein